MAVIFTPRTPLERAVHAGDQPQTLAVLRALGADERLQQAASVRRMAALLVKARWHSKDDTYEGWGVAPTPDHERALFAALVACAPADDIAGWVGQRDELLPLCSEFRPPSLATLGDALLAATPRSIETVQALIVAGLIERPQGERYALGLMVLPFRGGLRPLWDADPGLRDALLCILAFEGNREVSLAATDKYVAKAFAWSTQLCRLCDEGIYDRGVLLDHALSALECDWPQFRAGWHSRFHAELAPDKALLAARAGRYLGLCHSRIPPTVTLALAVLKQLEAERVVADDDLFAALLPVMHAQAKAQVMAALKLVDARVKRTPALASRASGLIVGALAHDAADVQGAVLQRLAAWGVDAALVEQLALYEGRLAAVHVPALQALRGHAAAQAPGQAPLPAVCASTHPVRGAGALDPLDAARQLRWPGDIDGQVAIVARALEDDCDTDAVEMASVALVCTAPFDAEQRKRLGPVVKRAGKVRSPVAQELGRLLLSLVAGEPLDYVGPAGTGADTAALLRDRTDAWIGWGLQGSGLPPLSAATHRDGWISPQLLVDRLKQHLQAGLQSPPDEQLRTLLRLSCSQPGQALESARLLPDAPFARALRYALGDEVPPLREHLPLFVAAAAARGGQADALLQAMLQDAGAGGILGAPLEWRVMSRSSEVDGRVYHHHHLIIECAARAPAADAGLLPLVRRRRAFDGERPWYYAHDHAFGGHEPCMVLCSAALLPNCLEEHLADGAAAIGNNLDWWEAQWRNKVYLQRLLDAGTPFGPAATLLLALGLGAKEPGEHALAVDALVAALGEGRLEVGALCRELNALSRTPLIKASRYSRSLRAALRLQPALHTEIFALASAMATACPDAPQKDVAGLLEIMQELMLACGDRVDAQTRAALEAMRGSGKVKTLVASLLAGP